MLQNIRKRLFVALTLFTTVFMLNQTEAKAWFGSMYPKECLKGSVHAVVDSQGHRRAKEEMTETDYENLKVTSHYKMKLYFLGDNDDKIFSKTFH